MKKIHKIVPKCRVHSCKISWVQRFHNFLKRSTFLKSVFIPTVPKRCPLNLHCMEVRFLIVAMLFYTFIRTLITRHFFCSKVYISFYFLNQLEQLNYSIYTYFQSVMMGLLVMTVSTNAVITVCPTLHVTNKRYSASEDVTRDIPPVTVVKVIRVVVFQFLLPL